MFIIEFLSIVGQKPFEELQNKRPIISELSLFYSLVAKLYSVICTRRCNIFYFLYLHSYLVAIEKPTTNLGSTFYMKGTCKPFLKRLSVIPVLFSFFFFFLSLYIFFLCWDGSIDVIFPGFFS